MDLAGEYEACPANFQRLNCQNTDPPSMDFQRMWAMYQRCILAATNGIWQQASVRVHLLPFLSVLKLLRLLREPIQQVDTLLHWHSISTAAITAHHRLRT